MGRIIRIIKSYLSLPVWVILWVSVILVPANLSGFAFVEYETGFWVAVLGSVGIFANIPILIANAGFSKAMSIPHLILWVPLHIILIYRWLTVADMPQIEQTYLVVILAVNTISLIFDFYDAYEWRKGVRDVAGYPAERVFI